MQRDLQNSINDSRVSAVKTDAAEYNENEIVSAIIENAKNLKWFDEGRGAFGKVIEENSSVVIKPNFVIHANQKTGGMLPLITHPSILKAVVSEVLKANPAQVIVGDAPIQSCNFEHLLEVTKLDEWAENLKSKDSRFKGIYDFRRTTCEMIDGVRFAEEDVKSLDEYVLYNLGADSLLEPLTDDSDSFRVTNYDPRLMAKTHSKGNHQYLVSRHIIEADTVINLPKLKTHRKAGITNALKNLVGINGNKEYLPHHRIGGADNGGDCYPGNDLVKRGWEFISDKQNMTDSPTKGKVLATIGLQLERAMRLKGDETGVEGAWSGNKTVPRMCLDLNRILHYGKPNAVMAETVQRRVLHIVDAVIAGQGDGPLSSDALNLKIILAGANASALDWVGAFLLGYDAEKIPLTRDSFDDFKWHIANFDTSEIELVGDWEKGLTADNLLEFAAEQNVVHPIGWRDAKAGYFGK